MIVLQDNCVSIVTKDFADMKNVIKNFGFQNLTIEGLTFCGFIKGE